MLRRLLVPIALVECLIISLIGCSAPRSSPSTSTSPATKTSTTPVQTLPPSSPSPTSQTPTGPIRNTWGWQASVDNELKGGQVVFFPSGGARVEAGRSLTLTWSSNGNVEAFILTSGQFGKSLNGQSVSTWAAHGQGQSGSINFYTQDTDSYFAVVRNVYPEASIILFQAEMTER
jgi:hypothetical protein